MAIEIQCGGCGTRYRVPETLAGKRARCKKCGTEMPIPGARPAGASSAVGRRGNAAKPAPAKRAPEPAEAREEEDTFALMASLEQTGRTVADEAGAADQYRMATGPAVGGAVVPPPLTGGGPAAVQAAGWPTAAPRARTAPSRRAGTAGSSWLHKLPTWILWLLIAFGVGGAVASGFVVDAGGAVLMTALVGLPMFAMAMFIWIVVIAFHESPTSGLLVLFCPFYKYYWARTRRDLIMPQVLHIAGVIVGSIVIMLVFWGVQAMKGYPMKKQSPGSPPAVRRTR